MVRFVSVQRQATFLISSISPEEDLYSCGGCATLGTGVDCTTIPSVLSVSCQVGACQGEWTPRITPPLRLYLTCSPHMRRRLRSRL
jgi:hypothetical protein